MGSNKAYIFRIDDLYTPLYTKSMTGPRDKPDSEEDVIWPGEHVLLTAILARPYVTVSGDAGTGKTTFLVYVASLLADPKKGSAAREKHLPAPAADCFPLFIRVAELCTYIRTCRETREPGCPKLDNEPGWIPHFLENRNKGFCWGLPPGFFE